MSSRTCRPALATSLSVAIACAVSCSQSGKHGGADALLPPLETGNTPAAAPAACQPSHTEASQVVFIGESFVALTRAIPTLLTQHAREAGAIAMTDSYRDFSVAGTELATGALRAQYRRAKKAGPIKVVLINSGGSDLLFARRCAAGYDERCRAITDAASELFAELKADGVQDVLYLFYPDPKGIGAQLEPALNTLRPELQKLCDTTSLVRCHWLDPRPIWEGHPEYSTDGLYPNSAGSQAIADAIWKSMLDACIAR